MNRAIMGGIIAGIAVMLSLSMIPANAAAPDNVCVAFIADERVQCTNELAIPQHIIYITESAGDGRHTAGCHYDVYRIDEIGGVDVWQLAKSHGADGCAGAQGIPDPWVEVTGP